MKPGITYSYCRRLSFVALGAVRPVCPGADRSGCKVQVRKGSPAPERRPPPQGRPGRLHSARTRRESVQGGGEDRFPWKKEIVTTVFWIGGENPTANNPVPNHSSSWDATRAASGGYDDPNRSHREDYMPANFTPHQNPFYCALPYNDKAREGHRPEAPKGDSVVQGRLTKVGCLRLQRSLDRDSQRQSHGLRAMGRCGPVSHRSLAIRFWQRTSETESEQRRRSRCFSGRARLPRLRGNRRDRLEVCRVQGGAARPLGEARRE